ncbi:ACP S-malonyltransferase [Paractinoplanes atraurantiacus]|uniref:[acyl-carrier-protein] S-malonyltransferase n=1 Tax=Paractinoplanes atraurantiacus TaxID=1036182 RepID=A0A285GL82_9ACTN|nr:ACP S-malonyltransferase [Actinoplanes atraurantiacus]SNY24327.1 trans-AT polyketide synthase, acyltransferase and oxidoreductase domain-containing protein [Actinoplanes atraurantiacus]
MTAWLFPGQGAQRRGMGGELFDRHPGLVRIADEILGYSVAELCRLDPGDRLSDTRYAQPALFVVGALGHLDRLRSEPPPSHLAGHSLGEYPALFAAGSFDFATGVRLVQRRGELMGRARGGGMLAVLGPIAAEAERLLAETGHTDVDVANDNADDQVVLSGPVESLAAVAELVRARGGRCQPLAVSAAFHSRYMADAAEAFAGHLAEVEIADPGLPTLSNVTGRPYRPHTVRELLAEQIRRPVRWAACMRHLRDEGVEEIAEIGPGTVLTGLWRAAARARRRAQAQVIPAALAVSPAPAAPAAPEVEPASRLGSAAFRRDYDVRYAYAAGAMYRGIASTDLVIRLGRAGLLGFFGAGGLRPAAIEAAVDTLEAALGPGGRWGMNLLCTLDNPALEETIVDLYLRRGVRQVEAAAYPRLTPSLIRYRFSGAHRDRAGRAVVVNRVLAKVSRPEVADAFLRPPPETVLRRLVERGRLSPDEAAVAAELPVSDDLCVESDSGGHTDGGAAVVLLPSIRRLRDEVTAACGYPGRVRVGAAGGLGTPEAVAAMFLLGADFVLTGSINQCTPEAGTSDEVKDILATLDVQDTAYAPAGDMLEAGARVQVVRRGTLFAARANRLLQLFRQYSSLTDVAAPVRRTIEQEHWGRTFDEVWQETRAYLAQQHPDQLARAERDPRRQMAHVLRWYFRHSTETALAGGPDRVNYQIHCGPAMGAFNRWAQGSDLEKWRDRHVDEVARRLMSGAAAFLSERFAASAIVDAPTPPSAAQQ